MSRSSTLLLPLLAFLPLLLLGGCGGAPTVENTSRGQTVEERLERANELSANRSELQIQGYMRRMGLDSLQSNGQGMYYRIVGKPIGQRAAEGVTVAIAYHATLLDGTACGQADTITPLEFTIGQRAVPVGLEELVRRMAPGQTGLGIVPPHLAYGLLGDRDCVPPNSCIVYRVEWLRYPL